MMNSEVAKKLSTELLKQDGKNSFQIRRWHRAGKVESKRKKTIHKSEITSKKRIENRCWESCKRLQGLDFRINMTTFIVYAGYLQGGPGVHGHPYARAPHVLPSNQANLVLPKCRGASELGSVKV